MEELFERVLVDSFFQLILHLGGKVLMDSSLQLALYVLVRVLVDSSLLFALELGLGWALAHQLLQMRM